jgi:hypothetical protein
MLKGKIEIQKRITPGIRDNIGLARTLDILIP